MSRIAFAVPGDINTLTGGYIYERRLLDGLRALGHDVEHIELPASFPDPGPLDCAAALRQLSAVGPGTPLIVDGLAFGSMATDDLAQLRAPLVALIHHPLAKESGLDDALRDHLFRTERDNLALARHVLVPSPHTASILTAEYGVPEHKLTIVRPGTDRPKGTSSPTQPSLILVVGIQAPRKGHDVLLRALSQIKATPWRAVIVGAAHDPVYASDLAELRIELGLQDKVELVGQVSSETLANLYSQASIFALATRYEGYGIVFDEALSNGLPIVSCATGAVTETVPAMAGILVPPDAPEAFADALQSLLSDPTQRDAFAQAAHRAGRLLPSWEDAACLASDALARVSKPKSAIGRSLDVYYRDAARTARMDKLHAGLLHDGALVFDIGSHVGDRADSFARLGANVVAFEPQPRVFRALRLILGRRAGVTLRNQAVGAEPGVLEMFINSANPTVSTASQDLINAAGSASAWQGQDWDKSVRVSVTTLDKIISEFGIPDFVKIDVEGFELKVLRGLSQPLPLFSFEFTTIQRDVALGCLDQIGMLGDYVFNYSLGEDHQFIFDQWVLAKDMATTLTNLPDAANSGDIFAKRVSAAPALKKD